MIPMKDNPTVTVMVLVEAGSKYETKEVSGISHFLEHMCFKGTKRRPTALKISQELDSLGSHYNAFTSQEFTGYYAKAQAKNMSTILDVVSDIYLNPVFEPVEIEKEKGVIVDEINMYEEVPARHIHDIFHTLLYGDQPAGWNIAGTRESVRSINREGILAYRGKNYVSGATVLVVAGSFDEESFLKEAGERFSTISEGQKHSKTKIKEEQKIPAVLTLFRDAEQSQLLLGVRSFDIFDSRTPAVNVLAAILGGGMSSRLFQKLRNEMGVGYSVHVWNDTYTDHGYLAFGAGVESKRTEEVITAVLAEFKKIAEEKVSESELSRVKEQMIGSLYLDLESSDSLAQFYAMQEILRKPLLLPEDCVKEIQTVTAEQIQKVAQEIFKTDQLNLALIGPFKESSSFEKLLHF